MKSLGRAIIWPWQLFLLAFVFLVMVVTAGSAKIGADGVIKSYKAKSTLQPGMIVSLVKGSKDTVQALPANSPQLVLGVVVDPSNVPLTITKSNSQVFVASSGDFPVLVSTQYGAIKNGDYISGSSIEGVAAAAGTDQAVVVGRSLQDFKGGSVAIFTAANGSAVGQVLAQISPGNNPKAVNLIGVPSTLKKVSNSIAGRNVSVLRVYGAVAILILGIITGAILLLGGIRHGMIAIGRNPLSRKSIYKSLIQVLVVVVLVFVASLMGIYILLKI